MHVAQVDGFCDDYDVDGQDMHILYINAAIQPCWYEKNQKSQWPDKLESQKIFVVSRQQKDVKTSKQT